MSTREMMIDVVRSLENGLGMDEKMAKRVAETLAKDFVFVRKMDCGVMEKETLPLNFDEEGGKENE